MERKELTCIGCPLGCRVTVEIDNKEVKRVYGHSCAKGERYAASEIMNPTRTLTSTIKVINGQSPVVSVKTSDNIPKAKIMECILLMKDIEVSAPVKLGQIIIANIADTSCNLIATKRIDLSIK